MGLALAGRAGARLAAQLGFGAGRMTLLRRVMALPDPRFSTPRVLGVDDFAIRRGQTYSTVLTSVEDHRVVDVLPTRDAGPLAAWLISHPGVEIICRDRAGAYAEGARRGAPDALQIADRFHLWQGLGRAVETCVAAHRDCLRNPMPSGMLPEVTRLASGRPQGDSAPLGRRAERKKAAHALVHELLAQGHSRRAIARHLGWGLNTVLRYANAARWQDTIRENRPRPSRLDPYKPYLERRFAEGCTSVTRLYGELITEQAHIATLRAAPAAAPPRPPTVRQVTGWLTRHPTTLAEDDRAGLKEVLARCPELDTAAGHVRSFGEILTDRLGGTLPAWIDAVDASQLPRPHRLRTPPTPRPRRRDSRPHSRLELRKHRRRRQPHQKDQTAALRPSRIRTPTQDDPAPVTLRDAPRSAQNREAGTFAAVGVWTGESPTCPAVARWPHVDPKGRCRVGAPRPSAQSGGGHDGSIRS
ncbi:transposase [Streptomyces sp. NPDC012637]|uniref:transposase n=1 Tax=Streptomyces sp. NPDC012637 TaxID=3364842 RepID=UPI0036ED72D7